MSTEQFLYQQLDTLSGFGAIPKDMPGSVSQNLHPRYELRPYQVEAFTRFFYCFGSNYPGKSLPLHFLFNMATGSGKTLIMAGLILYLYKQGYRNFLFFVNSTNIIEKTRDNFLNPGSIKYLFNPEMVMDNLRIRVTPAENFEGVNPNDINICFTTIQKLHSDLTTEKENSLTFEDFRKHKIILIADEAHHINADTKLGKELFESWENTVQRIFTQNTQNMLLEFTATHDFFTPAMVEKYRHKVIYRYDLREFRNDRYSKEVTLIYSDFAQEDRILQALILSEYKQEVAAKHRIGLKPVILFKAQRTIAQSQENKAGFHRLLDNLTSRQIARIRRSNIATVKQAFTFFHENGISDEQLVQRLKQDFSPEFCLSVNDDAEKEKYQILVNSLEDKNNHIRAIFAVQKLSEGWDVLNLFDIVRCYEQRDSGKNKLGKTTISEAQLIGRGARYFPFVLPANSDRFRRKYDSELDNELRVIEELHYHSISDSRYIAEIRTALVEQGILDQQTVQRDLRIKEDFKRTGLYKSGVIFLNSQVKSTYQNIDSFANFGITRKNFAYRIGTGLGGAVKPLNAPVQLNLIQEAKRKDIKLKDIPRNIIQSAIARCPSFTFSSLRRYFPHLTSIREFIESGDFLGGLEITFEGDLYQLSENKPELLAAVVALLNQIEVEMRQQITEYQGTREFHRKRIHEVFTDKKLILDKQSERARQDFDQFVQEQEWYAFDSISGTSEEKDFLRMLDRFLDNLKGQYDSIYVLRNENHFKLYSFKEGQVFEPDFVLFLKEKSGQTVSYQLFIEPKAKFIQDHDKWKLEFLKEITEEFSDGLITFENNKYRLVGVPFYNNDDENVFKASLGSVLSLPE